MRRVLFAGANDSVGSQMAVAFFNAFSAPGLVKGTLGVARCDDRLPSEATEVMKEIGFDLTAGRAQPLTPELVRSADVLICIGPGQLCPSLPGQRRIVWLLDEPKSWSREHLRPLRDEVRAKVWRLVAKEGWYKLQPVRAILRSWALQPGV